VFGSYKVAVFPLALTSVILNDPGPI
jgi:hypothetical protein